MEYNRSRTEKVKDIIEDYIKFWKDPYEDDDGLIDKLDSECMLEKMREEESRGGLGPLSSSGKGQWFQLWSGTFW